MALDADDRVSRLESRLFNAREQARAQQNTLDDILRLLQHLPTVEDSHIPGDPTAASRVPIPATPMSDSTPHARARGLKPATPNEFDGDRLKGRAFLNSFPTLSIVSEAHDTSPSLMSDGGTTMSVSRKVMNGRLHSAPTEDSSNLW